MIYLFYGTDKDKAREKMNALVKSLKTKKPEAEIFRMDGEHWSEREFDEFIGGQGLFHRAFIVELVSLFEDAEAKEIFLKKLQDIADSPNIFVMQEGKFEKEFLLAITEVAEKVQSFERSLAKAKPEFNIFLLTDAFGRRDKKNLWMLFRKAIASGSAPEEVHGLLFWQLKSMLLASLCKSAGEAGLKPFVWAKAKAFAKNWSVTELKTLLGILVSLYHDAHRGLHDFETALERLILSL